MLAIVAIIFAVIQAALFAGFQLFFIMGLYLIDVVVLCLMAYGIYKEKYNVMFKMLIVSIFTIVFLVILIMAVIISMLDSFTPPFSLIYAMMPSRPMMVIVLALFTLKFIVSIYYWWSCYVHYCYLYGMDNDYMVNVGSERKRNRTATGTA